MLCKQPYHARFGFILVFMIIVMNSFVLYPQSETLEKHIQEDLQEIDISIENKQYERALIKIEQLEKYSSYVSNSKNKLSLNLIKAQAYYGNEEQEKAINLLLDGLNKLEDSNNLLSLKIKYSSYLGKIFYQAKNFNKSSEYFRLTLRNSLTLKDTVNILDSYLFIGKNFFNIEYYDSAFANFSRVIKYPINDKTQDLISSSYNNLGVIAFVGQDLDSAEYYYNKTLLIKQQRKDTIGIAQSLINLSGVFYNKKEFKKAKNSYLEAFNVINGINSERALKTKQELLHNLAYASEQLKDFEEAYYYLEEASDLTDSLAGASLAQNISELEAKYNVEVEARKLEDEKEKHFRTQLLFYGLAGAFLLFLVFGYIFYNNYRLKQRHKLELVENEMNTKIINATIDAKEKERKTIAEILHDSVSALLSSANLHLMASKTQLKKTTPKEITKAQVILNEASIKIRDLSHNLISSVLLKFGLAFAVHDMCQKYSNSEISLFSDDNGIKRYDQDFEIKIHNIIEELINNVLKHSKASNATIMLSHRADDNLAIRINDDGVGFNVESVRHKDGLGLSHINARVKIMKGVFNIESSKDEGTSIFISVPIKLKEEAA